MESPKRKRVGPGPSYKRIYLVAPRQPDNVWIMMGTVKLLGAKTIMPNAALATLIALTPPDVSVEYIFGDENIVPIDLETKPVVLVLRPHIPLVGRQT